MVSLPFTLLPIRSHVIAVIIYSKPITKADPGSSVTESFSTQTTKELKWIKLQKMSQQGEAKETFLKKGFNGLAAGTLHEGLSSLQNNFSLSEGDHKQRWARSWILIFPMT